MKIRIVTQYDLAAMKALARGLRKTVRKKRSRRSHILGGVTAALGVMLLLSASEFNVRVLVTALAVIFILLALCFEDTLNGWIALRRGIPGLRSAITEFDNDGYLSITEVGESRFPYDNIRFLAETKDYYLLIMGPNHGQVFAKDGITEGTEEAFRILIQDRTKMTIFKV